MASSSSKEQLAQERHTNLEEPSKLIWMRAPACSPVQFQAPGALASCRGEERKKRPQRLWKLDAPHWRLATGNRAIASPSEQARALPRQAPADGPRI